MRASMMSCWPGLPTEDRLSSLGIRPAHPSPPPPSRAFSPGLRA